MTQWSQSSTALFLNLSITGRVLVSFSLRPFCRE